jgi:transcriptional regulator with XRE-family HTH domain
MPFATRLRELMDEAGIPQSALAENLNVTRQAVSAYSLGISLPDIEKFEGIANYFEVSTEYLLGHTDIKKADASKQAAAGYLGLSESAIDAIHSLRLGMLEQIPLRDYKPVFMAYPLVEVFSAWLETVDLPTLTNDMYKLLMVTSEYNTSGLHPEKYMMSDQQKQALMLLEGDNYVVLSLRDQLDYYDQIIQSAFRESVGKLTDQAAFLAHSDDTE